MTTVNVQEAKTHLSRLLERVEAGARIVIARAGRPIAEIRVKQVLGRLEAPDDLVRLLESQGLEALSLSATQAERLVDSPTLVRHDPFDRMLLAQAAADQLTLLTADRRLLDLDLPWVLDARR